MFSIFISLVFQFFMNRISGVMVRVLNSIEVDSVFEPRSCQSNDYKIGICCFSTKHTTFRRERAMTGCLDIRIICPSRATCLPAKCCFSELDWHMVQVLRTHRGHLSSNPRFQCGSICSFLCRSLFVLLYFIRLAILLSAIRLTASVYPFWYLQTFLPNKNFSLFCCE